MKTTNYAIFEKDRANNYDTFISDWMPYYKEIINHLPGLLGKPVPELSDELLVVGFGTGNEIEAVMEARPGWKITGVDPSPDMINIAREKLKGYKNLKLIEGRVCDLELKQQFDVATLFLVLHFLPDNGTKLELLKSIAERLKPGGRLILVDIFGTPDELQENLEVLRILLPAHLDREAIDDRIKNLPLRLNYVSASRLKELLKSAGFSTITRFFQMSIYGGWIIRMD